MNPSYFPAIFEHRLAYLLLSHKILGKEHVSSTPLTASKPFQSFNLNSGMLTLLISLIDVVLHTGDTTGHSASYWNQPECSSYHWDSVLTTGDIHIELGNFIETLVLNHSFY
jgi:hypothetical protein